MKCLKYNIKRVVGKTIWYNEELSTLIIQIAAVLNSRSLSPPSNDLNDVEALTRAHFLIGSSLIALTKPNYTKIPMNRWSRWQLVQILTLYIWRKWSLKYLHKLLNTPKSYNRKVEMIKKGNLVLI